MNNPGQWTPEKWQQTITAIHRRAASDAAFRQRCLTAPRQAIREVAGIDWPASILVEFAEPRKAIVITLPPFKVNGAGELTDAELEDASGGTPSSTYYVTDPGMSLPAWACPSPYLTGIPSNPPSPS